MTNSEVKKYENELGKIISSNENIIEKLFSLYGIKIAQLANVINIDNGTFKDSLNKNFINKLSGVVTTLYNNIDVTIQNGITDSWALSNKKNDLALTELFTDKRLRSLPSDIKNKYYTKNEDALKAFVNREINGLTLSENVWDKSQENIANINAALRIGIGNGIGKDQLAEYLQQYLKNPSGTITEVDEKGIARTIKTPYQHGVYSNPKDNAKRLARTEINMAYRTADHERWQQFDFVVGIEIKTSGNHPFKDICDQLAGKYPKDFKFTGWHPNCRCYQVTILKTEKEIEADEERMRKGEKPTAKSDNSINDVPNEFKAWVDDNVNNIEKAKNKPYFIKDNEKYYEQAKTSPHQITPTEIRTIQKKFDTNITLDAYNNSAIKGADILRIDDELVKGAKKLGFDFNDKKLTFEEGDGKGVYIKYNGDKCKIERRVFVDRDGDKIAEHIKFDLSGDTDKEGHPLYQGKGYSKTVLSAFYNQYKKIGVDEIQTLANEDVGSWCWARYGFCTYDKYNVMHLLDSVERLAKAKGLFEVMVDIVNKFYESPNVTINTPFPMNLLTKDLRFKDILLGKSWDGFLALDDAKQVEIFENYMWKRNR